MAARTEIDTDATGSGLAASAQARCTVIAGTDITLPQGSYVSGINTLAAGLIARRMTELSTRVMTGAAAARISVATYEASEQANAAILAT